MWESLNRFPSTTSFLTNYKLILPFAFHVERDCFPAVIDVNLTTTRSMVLVHRVLMFVAFARGSRLPPHSIAVISTP